MPKWFRSDDIQYNDQELSIILNKDETDRCRGLVPLVATEQTLSPVTDSPEEGTSSRNTTTNDNNQADSQSRDAQNANPQAPGSRRKRRHQSTVPAPDTEATQESYFCVDKPSLTRSETSLAEPVKIKDLGDDTVLFKLLKNTLKAKLGCIATPWMAYNAVNLCQVSYSFVP